MRALARRLKRFPSPLPLLFIVGTTIALIMYGRGYRPDFTDSTLKPTGFSQQLQIPKVRKCL
jgi:hypothetical protein